MSRGTLQAGSPAEYLCGDSSVPCRVLYAFEGFVFCRFETRHGRKRFAVDQSSMVVFASIASNENSKTTRESEPLFPEPREPADETDARDWISEVCDFGSQGCRFKSCRVQGTYIRSPKR